MPTVRISVSSPVGDVVVTLEEEDYMTADGPASNGTILRILDSAVASVRRAYGLEGS